MKEDAQEGYFQVYTGEGKGKTTAALGLALRASGRGYGVYLGQFMKGQDYGELHALPRLQTVTHEQYGDPGWVYKGKVTEAQRAAARDGLKKGREALLSGRYRIVILDEINMALWFELLCLEEVLGLIEARPRDVELVFTGRPGDRKVIRLPDFLRLSRHSGRKPARRAGVK